VPSLESILKLLYKGFKGRHKKPDKAGFLKLTLTVNCDGFCKLAVTKSLKKS
jgi:hypothetical protein